ncbi:hypothetical protein EAO74_23040 [Streptomyces sp. gb1(2016)]|uniref:Uncharacterized protein n=1 Tax=Streptomyces sp. gb1(2016) TaxID=1828321 RepID=A0A652KID4_9ACTN|nr:hypothetical protein EAO74_23040 [Streptomyces sp. gb1(2016)]
MGRMSLDPRTVSATEFPDWLRAVGTGFLRAGSWTGGTGSWPGAAPVRCTGGRGPAAVRVPGTAPGDGPVPCVVMMIVPSTGASAHRHRAWCHYAGCSRRCSVPVQPKIGWSVCVQ